MNDVELLKKNHVEVDKALELWGDLDTYNESLKEFNNSFISKLINLENFKEQSDWENYGILAHSIKSELKYLGFLSDAEEFYQHELKGKAADGTYINENFSHLRQTIVKIVLILNEYFGLKKNLLIADDSNIILNYLGKVIDENYNILKANDGKEALMLLECNHIYAILLDLNMPNVDGFGVLNYLSEHDLIDKIPVVVITGDDTLDTIQKAFSYPILDVLNKPFNEKNIKSILDSIDNFYNKTY